MRMLKLPTFPRGSDRSPLLPVTCVGIPVVVVALGMYAPPASAEATAPEQPHLRIGAADLAPKVILGGEYDSNAYREETDEDAVFSIVVKPSAVLAYKSEGVVLDATAAYHFQKYLDFKKDVYPLLTNLDRYRDGNVGFKLQILPKAVAGANLDGSIVSTSLPDTPQDRTSALLQRFASKGAGRLAIRPGAALEFQGGAYVAWDDYSVPEAASPDEDTDLQERLAYAATLTGRWQFLPRTSVVLEGTWEWFTWSDNLVYTPPPPGIEPGEKGIYTGKPDGDILKVQGGLRGRVTERFNVNVLGGWTWGTWDEQSVLDEASLVIRDLDESVDDDLSQGFGADPEGVDRLLVMVAGEYALDQTTKVSAGYVRDVQDVYFTNYLIYDHVYARYQRLLTPTLGAILEGGYRFESFRGEVTRDDHVLRARGDITWSFNRWLSTDVGVWWDERASVGGRDTSSDFDNVNVHLQLIAVY